MFLIGIVAGMIILFSVIGYQKLGAFMDSNRSIANTPTSDNSLPRLIALIPTDNLVQVTQTFTPSPTPEPSPTETEFPPTLTATPLYLIYHQTPEIIGHSINGLPLKVYTFGSGEHERMIIAGIHGGDEWNTVTLANQLIAYVNQHPEIIPSDVTLYILRNLNPDGETRAHDQYGRVNANGVDLNRNFPTNWSPDWDRAGCWNYLPTTSGSAAGSESETQALMNFIEGHHIEALISYHSAALGVFPGGDPWDESSVDFAEALAAVSSYPFPPIDTGCKYSGTLADYAVSKGITAVDLELTNHFDTDFDVNIKIIEVLLTFKAQN